MNDKHEPAKDPADIGQVAYEAYCDYVGWKSVHDDDLPGFSQQAPRIQNAWRMAADAVAAAERDHIRQLVGSEDFGANLMCILDEDDAISVVQFLIDVLKLKP